MSKELREKIEELVDDHIPLDDEQDALSRSLLKSDIKALITSELLSLLDEVEKTVIGENDIPPRARNELNKHYDDLRAITRNILRIEQRLSLNTIRERYAK